MMQDSVVSAQGDNRLVAATTQEMKRRVKTIARWRFSANALYAAKNLT
ncbi:MAG: hypothetical protein ACLTFJ_00605 [Clostridium sp.]